MVHIKNPKKREVSFDEVTADVLGHKSMSYRERPLSSFIFFISVTIFIFFAIIVLFRIIYLGGIKGDFYRVRASSNVNRITTVIADRGFITDRYGQNIVANIPVLSLRLRPAELVKYEEKNAVKSVLANFGITEKDFNEILAEYNLEKSDEIVLKREVSKADAIAVEGSGLKSIYIVKNTKRAVTPEFSHIVGHVGFPTRDMVRERGFSSLDVVGKNNLEAIFDEVLRGVNGRTVAYRDVRGNPFGAETFSEPRSGDNLTTTIDAELQRFFYERLNKALNKDNPGGVGIVMSPLNGEVLSLVSLPGFDSTNLTEALNDRARPLFNRAVSGFYSPGSTIKPIVAVAALKEGIIRDNEEVLSTGYLEIPNRYNPDSPARFVDWRPHGWVDVYSAIARSSNIFFYAVSGGLPHNTHLFRGRSNMSSGLGIARLRQYYDIFGLGERTGIALSSESAGILPSPEDKKRRTGDDWMLGDTYNTSIGQGYMLVTPISLINSIAAIFNGGILYKPNLILGNKPEKLSEFTHLASELNKSKEGMKDAVREPYGTATMLNRLPFEIGGKTGSAQVTPTQTNAFFAGCGPMPLQSENYAPICVLVVVEHAVAGALNAVPVAYDVFRWYYDNRININNENE